TAPWKDDGKEFSVTTLADDLGKFITLLNAGPVHVVGWSFGGPVIMAAAVQNPSLFRSVILYEGTVTSILPADSAKAKRRAKTGTRCVLRHSPRERPGPPSRRPTSWSRPCSNCLPADWPASRRSFRRAAMTTPASCRSCSQLHHRRRSRATCSGVLP